MKTLKQYLNEKLIINKNFKGATSISDGIKDAFDKHNVKFKLNNRTDNHYKVTCYSNEYSAALNNIYDYIDSHCKETKFDFEKKHSDGINYYEVTNDKNIAICTFSEFDEDACRSIWIIGKNFSKYICFSSGIQGATYGDINKYIAVVFNNIDLTKVYSLEENIVPDCYKIIKTAYEN